jgi:hypothetical protein
MASRAMDPISSVASLARRASVALALALALVAALLAPAARALTITTPGVGRGL